MSAGVVNELAKQTVRSDQPTKPSATEPVSAPAPKKIELSSTALAGKALFSSGTQPGCGVCHTLANVGGTGAEGPNLDTLDAGIAQLEAAIKNGVGVMPAFGGQLSTSEIAALAASVKEATQ